MEANLRIIKSIEKINKAILKNEAKSEELNDKQLKLQEAQIDTIKSIEEIINEQKNLADSQNEFEQDIMQEVNERLAMIQLMPGPKGDKGDSGYTPRKGIDYFDGKDGRDGKDGKDGIGLRGEKGEAGRDGQDGIGIYEIKINEDGDLIITLTNGKKINCGRVRGKDGMNGFSVSVVSAEIRNSHLYIKLSTGKEIDAGDINAGSVITETDPTVPSYIKEITENDITSWNNKSEFSGSYNDLTDKPDLFSGDYEDLENKPTIPTVPTNVSAFNNDAGYLTEHQDISNKEDKTNKIISITSNSSDTDYPSAKAVFDGFQRKPVIIWESNIPANYLKAINADISASPAWQLTNLDMTPFKRIKIYSCAGRKSSGIGIDASTTPAIVLEMSLDSRNAIADYGNNYIGSIVVQKPNDANRLAILTCAVSADKTSFVVLRQTSLYGTGATSNNDANANVFMIEGYYD